MQLSFTEKKNIRKNFGKLKESLSIPNLIEVQKNSYKELTEYNKDHNINLTKGFNRVFKFFSSLSRSLLSKLPPPLGPRPQGPLSLLLSHDIIYYLLEIFKTH